MEWHQYFRSVCECWIVLIYDTGRGVQADQEDGIAEIKLSFTTSSPIFVGFFVCGMMSRFKNDNFFIIGKKKIIMMKYLLKKDKK